MLEEVLKERREALGLNLGEAAERFGVSRQAYTLWEKGAYGMKLDADKLATLADFLGTDNRGALVAIGWLNESPAKVGHAPRHNEGHNGTTQRRLVAVKDAA